MTYAIKQVLRNEEKGLHAKQEDSKQKHRDCTQRVYVFLSHLHDIKFNCVWMHDFVENKFISIRSRINLNAASF